MPRWSAKCFTIGFLAGAGPGLQLSFHAASLLFGKKPLQVLPLFDVSALHPFGPHEGMGAPALKDLQQWFKDHQPAGPGTNGSKVGCVSMVSVGEPWGRAHASAEEVGGRIPRVGAQAP